MYRPSVPTRLVVGCLKLLFLVSLLVVLQPGQLSALPPEPEEPRWWVGVPAESVRFDSGGFTQSVTVLDERDTITLVPVRGVDRKWSVPGGMEEVKGWTSTKYKLVPEPGVVHRLGTVGVVNSYGYTQHNRAIVREYPDDTRFDEVLTNVETGNVFEHRVRQKVRGKWVSTVEFADEGERPDDYTGLKQSCSSCHALTGTGAYGAGLVPGGDTVISDPLDPSVVPASVLLRYSPGAEVDPPPLAPRLTPKVVPLPQPSKVPVTTTLPPFSSRTVVTTKVTTNTVRMGPIRRLFSGGRCR